MNFWIVFHKQINQYWAVFSCRGGVCQINRTLHNCGQFMCVYFTFIIFRNVRSEPWRWPDVQFQVNFRRYCAVILSVLKFKVIMRVNQTCDNEREGSVNYLQRAGGCLLMPLTTTIIAFPSAWNMPRQDIIIFHDSVARRTWNHHAVYLCIKTSERLSEGYR